MTYYNSKFDNWITNSSSTFDERITELEKITYSLAGTTFENMRQKIEGLEKAFTQQSCSIAILKDTFDTLLAAMQQDTEEQLYHPFDIGV